MSSVSRCGGGMEKFYRPPVPTADLVRTGFVVSFCQPRPGGPYGIMSVLVEARTEQPTLAIDKDYNFILLVERNL